MYLASRWLFRNLSRLELVAAWLVILLLIGGFTRYVFGVFARAEQSMVSRTVNNIDTALKYHFAMAAIMNDHEILGKLQDMNPMDIMQGMQKDYFLSSESMISKELAAGYPFISKPANYGGTVASTDWRELEKGKWYFDNENKTLVYLVRNPEFFRSHIDGPDRLRFRMVIDYADINANNKFDPGIDEYRSVRMRSLDEYEWTI